MDIFFHEFTVRRQAPQTESELVHKTLQMMQQYPFCCSQVLGLNTRSTECTVLVASHPRNSIHSIRNSSPGIGTPKTSHSCHVAVPRHLGITTSTLLRESYILSHFIVSFRSLQSECYVSLVDGDSPRACKVARCHRLLARLMSVASLSITG